MSTRRDIIDAVPRAAGLLLLAALLSACGQTGPLSLPEAPVDTRSAADTAADEDEDEDDNQERSTNGR